MTVDTTMHFRHIIVYLLDDKFNISIEEMIREEQVNAEYAVKETGAYFTQLFKAMEDDYLKERATDMKDVSNRVIEILNAESPEASKEEVEGRGGWQAGIVNCSRGFGAVPDDTA